MSSVPYRPELSSATSIAPWVRYHSATSNAVVLFHAVLRVRNVRYILVCPTGTGCGLSTEPAHVLHAQDRTHTRTHTHTHHTHTHTIHTQTHTYTHTHTRTHTHTHTHHAHTHTFYRTHIFSRTHPCACVLIHAHACISNMIYNACTG